MTTKNTLIDNQNEIPFPSTEWSSQVLREKNIAYVFSSDDYCCCHSIMRQLSKNGFGNKSVSSSSHDYQPQYLGIIVIVVVWTSTESSEKNNTLNDQIG